MNNGDKLYHGLSKREYFAGLMLQGILGNEDMLQRIRAVAEGKNLDQGSFLASMAVANAENLLEALEES